MVPTSIYKTSNGATPLHRAVRTRCAAAVKFLLSAGSDPTIRNKRRVHPFHLAVQNTGPAEACASGGRCQREIIKTFLSFGVSPDSEERQRKKPLPIPPRAPGFENSSLGA